MTSTTISGYCSQETTLALKVRAWASGTLERQPVRNSRGRWSLDVTPTVAQMLKNYFPNGWSEMKSEGPYITFDDAPKDEYVRDIDIRVLKETLRR